jgi:hypothetical protein
MTGSAQPLRRAWTDAARKAGSLIADGVLPLDAPTERASGPDVHLEVRLPCLRSVRPRPLALRDCASSGRPARPRQQQTC